MTCLVVFAFCAWLWNRPTRRVDPIRSERDAEAMAHQFWRDRAERADTGRMGE